MKNLTKKEIIEKVEHILDLTEGKADPYADNMQKIIQIQSVCYDILGRKNKWLE